MTILTLDALDAAVIFGHLSEDEILAAVDEPYIAETVAEEPEEAA